MKMYDILDKKRNNIPLSKEEIEFVVNGYTNGNIPDYQMSALLMAICINGMNDEEIVYLTKSMTDSGDKVDLSELSNTVDKHSTGGIGDKTTLIITPIVACLGCNVAKMSGRGLGFTGGTIDKLESIPGFRTKLSREEFINQVKNIHVSVIGQSENIAPADKKIYALRDVTSTVQSIPLIASSIMSKKIASGAKNLVLDVKVGSGAFMKDLESARNLASTMVKIGRNCGINTVAVLTNMDIPLGNKIGNLLEVEEAIDVLNNKGPEDLKNVCICLAATMNSITNNISYEESFKQVKEVLESGKAYNKFKELVIYQGGDLNNLNNNPKYSYEIKSLNNGFISNINSENIGKISVSLGAGRMNLNDEIDYTAGVILNKKINDYVNIGDTIATLYTSREIDFKQLENEFLNSIEYSDNKKDIKLIFDVINK
ncbi:MAG: thymidine phosphorylase [Firmicutes bacterium]|nr:thymidine phosphorylase [Bacillota bacterium]